MVTIDGGDVTVTVLVKVCLVVTIDGEDVTVTVLVKVCLVVIFEEHPVTIKKADKNRKTTALLCRLTLSIYFPHPLSIFYSLSSVIAALSVKIIVNES